MYSRFGRERVVEKTKNAKAKSEDLHICENSHLVIFFLFLFFFVPFFLFTCSPNYRDAQEDVLHGSINPDWSEKIMAAFLWQAV